MKLIQVYFGGIGRISKERNNCCDYSTSSLNQIITKIIPHFEKYPLVTNKRADYLLWKKVAMKMHKGEHLTTKGLQSIVNIRASLNKGLSLALKKAFPNNAPVSRDLFSHTSQENSLIYAKLEPQWVAGFISGEGSFSVNITKSKPCETKEHVKLVFRFNQHIRDELLIKSFVNYFGCGSYYSYKKYTE